MKKMKKINTPATLENMKKLTDGGFYWINWGKPADKNLRIGQLDICNDGSGYSFDVSGSDWCFMQSTNKGLSVLSKEIKFNHFNKSEIIASLDSIKKLTNGGFYWINWGEHNDGNPIISQLFFDEDGQSYSFHIFGSCNTLNHKDVNNLRVLSDEIKFSK